MRIKDVAVVVLSLAGIALPAWPQTADDIRAWDEMRANELRRLPERVRSYAESIGCNVEFEPRNIVRWEGTPGIRYVALITLDDGCAGGTRNWRSAFVAVREGAHGKLYVHSEYSSPEVTSMQFPQLIDVLYNTAHGVRFVGRVTQDNDPANRPSKRVVGTVAWSDRGWVVLDGECSVKDC